MKTKFLTLLWLGSMVSMNALGLSSDKGQSRVQQKQFGLNITPVGLTHNALARSIEGNYFYKRDTIFTLQYSELVSSLGTLEEDKYSEDELRIWKRNGKGSSISVGAKQFYGSTFYIKGEGYYRHQDHVNLTGSRIRPGTLNTWVVDLKETGRIEDIGLGFRLGNQWQWDYLTIGVDWAGFNRSLSIRSKRGSLDHEDIHTYNLLNFYIGANF